MTYSIAICDWMFCSCVLNLKGHRFQFSRSGISPQLVEFCMSNEAGDYRASLMVAQCYLTTYKMGSNARSFSAIRDAKGVRVEVENSRIAPTLAVWYNNKRGKVPEEPLSLDNDLIFTISSSKPPGYLYSTVGIREAYLYILSVLCAALRSSIHRRHY